MNKKDLKKLALLGLTSGCLLSQAPVQAAGSSSAVSNGIQIAKSCGAGCGGNKSASTQSKGQVAENDFRPQAGCSGARPQASCGGNAGNARPQASCGGNAGNARPQSSCNSARPQSSCGGARPQNTSRPNPAQGGCGGSARPNFTADNDGSYRSYPAQSGCGGSSRNQTAQNGCGGRRSSPNGQWADNDNQALYNNEHNVTTQQLTPPTAQQEQEFVNQLNNEGKAQYQTLDPQARALAVKLSSQYQDKNEAVKVAIQRIATKRAQY